MTQTRVTGMAAWTSNHRVNKHTHTTFWG